MKNQVKHKSKVKKNKKHTSIGYNLYIDKYQSNRETDNLKAIKITVL